ncbi:MAG TPA: hypothetical protein VM680_18405 [Verrucomicrobiae bacterium]|nr:hypothetical protein [Verrucomicrobiae bacterium]
MTDRELSFACQNIITITHICGYIGAYEEFCFTPIFGELPRGEFQCPQCKQAWTIRNDVPHPRIPTWLERKAVPIATRL